MFCDCHIHMLMDAKNYKNAVARHADAVDEEDLRAKLSAYQQAGVTFLRDGGDAWGVSKRAAQLAPAYGITYRTPVFAIHKNGHYGSIVGFGFDDMNGYRDLIRRADREGADFIKIMVSGILDFSREGALTEPSLSKEEIREMVHIAHEEGFAVMAHVNGAEAILAAIEAGADSVEHGNFIDDEGLLALKEHDTVWVPTFVTITNLIGSGRYEDEGLIRLKERQGDLIRRGLSFGVSIAPGSDAGAYRVEHAAGSREEYRQLYQLCEDLISLEEFRSRMECAAQKIQQRFQRESLNL